LIKRGIDAAVALGSLIVLSPLLLLLALGVKLSSPGPVIFGQDRIGAGSKPFKIYKFRSMRHGSSGQGKNNWTVEDDTRRTRFGSFMRRTNLDELPQLWNILKGDMSLIGPRPEQPQFVEQLTKEVSRYQERHQIRPGLTGWAQVNGWRGNTSIPERVQYDLFYLENWSLLFDLKIILYTFFSFFHGRGAY
ncbi:MAG TPA: exopolysaccharide biosynthesis polyprenyl glycosylphosphotransferase, partial [bacterium]|nr:exopolysaccharide biosynthesis polyprenyl glycosylphosphotransferase [bacterium]